MFSRKPTRAGMFVAGSLGLLAMFSAVAERARSETVSASPSRQLVAFTFDAGGQVPTFELGTITSQGKDVRLLAPAPGGLKLGDFAFTWSPDGRSIAYPCAKNTSDEHVGVCGVDVSTRQSYRITHVPSMKIEPYAWGPRNQIASDCDDRDLCLVDANTGKIRFVTRTGSSARNHLVFGDDLVWSPDGTTLAFTCRRNDQQDRRFCILGRDGKLSIQSRSWNAVRVEGWTPDSRHIVWWGRFSGKQPLGYHEQNVDGSGLEPLPVNAVVIGPHYTADGRRRLTTMRGTGLAEETVSGSGRLEILVPQGNLLWTYAFQPRKRSPTVA
jgi:Tol biopolymer transport system component